MRSRGVLEFVAALDDLAPTDAEGYLRRVDFSRWIDDVFGDHALARELRDHEQAYARSKSREEVERIVAAVTSRYDLTSQYEGIPV